MHVCSECCFSIRNTLPFLFCVHYDTDEALRGMCLGESYESELSVSPSCVSEIPQSNTEAQSGIVILFVHDLVATA